VSGATGDRTGWLPPKLAAVLTDRMFVAGLIILVLLVAAGLFQIFLIETHRWPRAVYHHEVGFDREVASHPAPPSRAHPLGTDYLGQDVLSMLLVGIRVTAIVGLSAALTSAAVGLAVAATVVAHRSVQATTRLMSDTLLVLPAPVLVAIIGTDPRQRFGSLAFGILFGVLAGASTAGIVLRSSGLLISTSVYIDAARVAGTGDRRIFTHHLLPHLIPLTAVYAAAIAGVAIVTDGFLAWFNLTSTRFNLGTIAYKALAFRGIMGGMPWIPMTAAAAAITLFGLSFFQIAAGIRRVLR
jgi:peptide/nickel transport system permease protein